MGWLKNMPFEKALIFPGQGSQYVGMGKTFYDEYDVVKEIYHKASDILHFDVARICFEENEKINITEYTQPALLTTQYAMLKVFESMGYKADLYAGLSLGEYSSAVASGAMDFEDAVLLVNKRGKLMQSAAPIGETMMLAIIGLSDEEVLEICGKVSDTLSITNYNVKGQVVIGGYKKDVLEANKLAEEAKAIKVNPLEISVASHCFIQKEAAEELKKEMEQIKLNDIETPYISNVTADLVTDKEDIKTLLVEQMYSPVKWAQTAELMKKLDVHAYYEFGGDVLTKMLKRVHKKAGYYNIIEPKDLLYDGD